MTRVSRQPGSHGFTLVELVVVMVIIGVVGAIAIPRFSQATARHQLDAAAQRVMADLELAADRASAARLNTTLTFNTSNDSYSFDTFGGEAYTVELGQGPYEVDMTRAKFGTSNVATFDGYGTPAQTGSVVLSSGDSTVTIFLEANGVARR